jgi:TonB family protein
MSKKHYDGDSILHRLFSLLFWFTVCGGVCLLIGATLMLGFTTGPKPTHFNDFIALLVLGTCASPVLLLAMYRSLLYIIYGSKVTFKFKKLWQAGFIPTLLLILLIVIGYFITIFSVSAEKQNTAATKGSSGITDDNAVPNNKFRSIIKENGLSLLKEEVLNDKGWTRLTFDDQSGQETSLRSYAAIKSTNSAKPNSITKGQGYTIGTPIENRTFVANEKKDTSINFGFLSFQDKKLPIFTPSFNFGYMHEIKDYAGYIIIDHLYKINNDTYHYKPFRYYLKNIEVKNKNENVINFFSTETKCRISFNGLKGAFSWYNYDIAWGDAFNINFYPENFKERDKWIKQISYLQFVVERIAYRYSDFWKNRHLSRLGKSEKNELRSTSGEDKIDLSELDREPRPRLRAPPQYPPKLLLNGISGRVDMLILIDEEGNVKDHEVVRYTHEEFKQQAMRVIRRWEFYPAIKDGKRVSVRKIQPFYFGKQAENSDDRRRYDAIFEAVKKNQIDTVKQQLGGGVDINSKDDDGFTAIHWAVYRSHKELIELLIDKGANVNAKDIYGKTPLDYADGDIPQLLWKHGARTRDQLKQ